MITRRSKRFIASASALVLALTFALPASARLATNRLASNKLAANGVSLNGASLNRLAANRIAVNAVRDKAKFDTQAVTVLKVTLPDGTVLTPR